ncbi:LPXTG cell wall anchor domain-containing protein [Micromonospora sp. NPDC051006]|uniref:LPXTG cell wall anchor domain-containing protein n=1 Tax=Micromonospora sp. NPDC051006 TaxID=3364283 RepID=UPI00378DE423
MPAGCTKADTGYVCRTAIHPLAVDQAVTWGFGLRVDAAGELTGTVTAKSSTADVTSDNDVAKLVVNPAGGAGGGGEDGPSLPITGQSGILLGGGAAALLAAGAALFVVARRRRTRFVA